MRPICWLHISDIHIRTSDAWSQNVALTALCNHMIRQHAEDVAADFILVTGDLAFSGKADEYDLAAGFFDALSAASSVPKERIFCVPGNHDIDRDRQKMCFLGARTSLQDQNRVDALLAGGEDLESLLKRQESYRQFQKGYFTGQDRTCTDDGLGYVSRFTIEDVRLAIVGLDSAWLAEGDVTDHGRLLIGERQVINALRLAQECDDPPHIIVGMAHHPPHMLQEFDRRLVQNRIESLCYFCHCGHLHEPETRTAAYGDSRCLTLAAGASFETRHSRNTYSVVTLDLLQAKRTVRTIQYNPSNRDFSSAPSREYRIEVTPAATCSVRELAQAMSTYCAEIAPWAHYLSALLLDQKADFPIPAPNGHAFGSFALLQAQPDGNLRRKTADFMAFRNALRVLYGRVALPEIFARHGVMVAEYGIALEELCKTQPAFKARLTEYESDAQILSSAEPTESFSHTGALLAEIAAAQDWVLLREQAQRHADSCDGTTAIQAKRMLALGLAHSDEADDRAAAIELYRTLIDETPPERSDTGNLAALLMDARDFDGAKAVVLGGLGRFPANRADFFELGQKIVEATGDRGFRKQLEAAIQSRG